MKGAKGGKRDRDISYKYHIKNTTKEQDFLDEALRHQEERIYEDKVKSLEHEDVTLSPLSDKEIDTDALSENTVKVKPADEVKIEEDVDLNKKKAQEVATSEKKKKLSEEDAVIYEEQEEIKKEETKIEEQHISEDKKESLEQIELEEAYIFYELEKAVKEDLFDLKDIEYRIQAIEDELEEKQYQEEIDELRRELELLLEKFDKLKYKYENFDFDIHPDIDDGYLETLIRSYGENINKDGRVSDLIGQIEETRSYIGIIETVAVIEDRISKLEDNVDEKYSELGDRDYNFEKLEDSAYDVEKISDNISYMAADIEDNLKDIENKLKDSLNFSSYTKNVSDTVFRMDRVINATLLMSASVMLPHTLRGNIVRAGLMAGAIHNFANVIDHRNRSEVRSDISYVDYSQEIIQNAKSIDDVSDMVDDALEDIDTIRYRLNTEFRQYIDLIPEYKTLLEKIDTVEKELEEQKYLIEKYDAQMKQQFYINEEKKYVKEYNNNN